MSNPWPPTAVLALTIMFNSFTSCVVTDRIERKLQSLEKQMQAIAAKLPIEKVVESE